MAEVIFDKVEKIYDNDVHAVHDLSLEIRDGEFVVLVGPSGCGKTTALRMVAGLEEITDGKVSIGGRVVNDLTPKERDIAMVFQNYALYPHLSVVGQHRLRAATAQDAEERGGGANRLGSEAPRPDPVPPPPAERVVRRTAPAGRDGPRNRAAAAGVPDGRAALQPRREAARADACGDRSYSARGRSYDDLRHPRPGRSDDDGRSRCRDAQRASCSRWPSLRRSITHRKTSSWRASSAVLR